MVFLLAGEQVLPLRARQQGTLYRSHTSAQRDGHTSYGPCAQQHTQRRAGPQGAHGRQERVLDSRHRPCQHSHRVEGGRPPQGEGNLQGRPHPRGVPQVRLGMEGGARRNHPPAAPQARRLLRLGPHPLHDGARAHRGRDRHVLLLLQEGHDLQGSAHGQLGPRCPHRHQRRRGGAQGHQEPFLLP